MPAPAIDIAHFREFGWVRLSNAVPAELCTRLVTALESESGVPIHDPSRWDEYGGPMRDFVPIWGHQAQWDIRQYPPLHRLWAMIWNTDALNVSMDSCRFTPPWKPGHAEPYDLHCDQNPWDATITMRQGVLALTDTDVGQGGFRCVPSLYRDHEAWPKAPQLDADGDPTWLADTSGHEIVSVSAQAGDLIIWDYRLPHGNSKNISNAPRVAFYVAMFPAGDEAHRQAAVESWRSGCCVPWWRSRPGYDHVEPWPPAALTELGRRLLGLDPW
jgi:hypothetical protein